MARQGRPYRLHYFNRPYTLRAFGLQETWRKIVMVLSVPHQVPADPRWLLVRWLRHVGRRAIYLSGSQTFTAQVRDCLHATRGADDDLHYELFSPAPLAQVRTFIVQLHPSGQLVAVTAERTIVEALGMVGIETENACGIRICGTCQARLVHGIPDHRDNYLTQLKRTKRPDIAVLFTRSVAGNRYRTAGLTCRLCRRNRQMFKYKLTHTIDSLFVFKFRKHDRAE